MAAYLMLQGTGSNVGKSVLVTALCRIFYRLGYRVAPFKAQNMALNSGVTPDGGEIGRAQVVQAQAAGVAPRVEMNPVLLKPSGPERSQVILLGRPVADMGALQYHLEYSTTVLDTIRRCLETLGREFDLVIMEGAGSPAEVNLKARDIANMKAAELAGAPVLLVTDIDRGGALAAVVGTLELLEPAERERVAGIIINKFRGNRQLLQPALDFLESRTGKPVLGVIPYLEDHRIPAEDSVALEDWREGTGQLEAVVPRLGYISNFTDLDALRAAGVRVRLVRRPAEVSEPDLVILPGSKNTIRDLTWLEESGLGARVRALAAAGVPVLGLCGGYQMLGLEVRDPQGVEGDVPARAGLGLLPVRTTLLPGKVTHQAEAVVVAAGGWLAGCRDARVRGYEIHSGRTRRVKHAKPAFRVRRRSGQAVSLLDGAVSENGLVVGTYLHGILDNPPVLQALLEFLRRRRGLHPGEASLEREDAYDRLAAVVREHLDLERICRLVGLPAEAV